MNKPPVGPDPLTPGRRFEDLCSRCGHTWYEHCWIVYTECWQCDCRYFCLPPDVAKP
jgi:hypothetical protein